jgi:hypothetical protein
LCSTLAALFEGERELFKGLAIDKMDWDWTPRPVVRIDLNSGDYSQGLSELTATLQNSLESSARKLGLELRGKSLGTQFSKLLEDAHLKTGKQVVVVIDEYDKPLLGTVDDKKTHKILRNALKGFYGVLKSADAHLRLSFITGVTKFSKVSIFSDLNNLTDLTLNPDYADLCGITQKELESNFVDEMGAAAKKNRMDIKAYKAKLKKFYNGYRFTEKNLTVYNPFGLLKHFFNHGKFHPWWFESGSPSFLVKLVKDQKIDLLNLENLSMGYSDLNKSDVETMRAVPVLYQAGYLTIRDYKSAFDIYRLGWPNDEVRLSFANEMLALYMPSANRATLTEKLVVALQEGDVDGFMEALQPFYNEVPNIVATHTEYFDQVIFLYTLRMLGFYCTLEEQTVVGRIDAVLEAGD